MGDYNLEVTGDEVNQILVLLRSMYPEPDRQLMVLALTFQAVGKSCGLPKSRAMKTMSETWDIDLEMEAVQ